MVKGKYRCGKTDRSKSKGGPGKNAKHGHGGQHSQKAKGNKPAKGGKILGIF